MTLYHWIVVIGVLAASCSQILLKQSAKAEHASILRELLNWRVALSYFIFFITVLVNIWCLGKGVMVKDMPVIEAMGYIFVPVLSYFFLGERINFRYVLSLCLVLAGIVIFYM